MSGKRVLSVAATVIAALVLLPSCSGDGTAVEPGSVPVSLTGSLDFPAGATVDLEDVMVGMASSRVSPDTNGDFSVVGNSNITSMVIAYDHQDTLPMLMGIVADPQEGAYVEMDLHSTALALAFLCPFICVSDPDGADEVLTLLEGLDELEDLEDLLETKLDSDPYALSVEDAEIDSALSRVVLAYMNSYPEVMLRNYPGLAGTGDIDRSAASTVLQIDPSYEKSGHRVTYVSGDKFTITNSLGRWAYCVTPTDSFYVWPNGTLLDALRGDPFKTSSREFELSVVANEPAQHVYVYGYGMAPDPDNLWSNLGDNEEWRAHYGGLSTFFFEFMPHVVSVISGVNKTVGNKEIAEHWAFLTMQLLTSDARMMERTGMYLQEGNLWGMAWFYTKWGIKKIATQDAIGEMLVTAIWTNFTEEQFALMVANANIAVRVVVTSDAVASVIKTLIGFRNSRFKTTFEIWKETVGFGNISGTVHDAADGTPIPGVTVTLEGDDGNPMDPSHEETTSSTGAFFFENIMAGEKTLEFSKVGYEAKSLGVTVQSGKTTAVAVTLG
ncbi:MAG: carboxypeptidase-like regulatory domain-containing protein, partial [bacterium]